LKRVLIVDAASPPFLDSAGRVITVTHDSTCKRRSARIGVDQKVTERPARVAATAVLVVQVGRAVQTSHHSPK